MSSNYKRNIMKQRDSKTMQNNNLQDILQIGTNI